MDRRGNIFATHDRAALVHVFDHSLKHVRRIRFPKAPMAICCHPGAPSRGPMGAGMRGAGLLQLRLQSTARGPASAACRQSVGGVHEKGPLSGIRSCRQTGTTTKEAEAGASIRRGLSGPRGIA